MSFGTSGWGADGSISNSKGNANADTVTHNNTHINGSNSTKIISGGDTNLVGANVSGKTVMAEVGGNLNIASEQDTSHSAAHENSSGAGFDTASGLSGSVQNGNGHGDYPNVSATVLSTIRKWSFRRAITPFSKRD